MKTRSQIKALTAREISDRHQEDARATLSSPEYVQQWYMELVALTLSLQRQIGLRRTAHQAKHRPTKQAQIEANREFNAWRLVMYERIEKLEERKSEAIRLIHEYGLGMPAEASQAALVNILAIVSAEDSSNGHKVRRTKDILERLVRRWEMGES